MSNLEKKEKEVNLKKLEAARAGLELKILKLQEEIDRINEHLLINEEAISKLKKDLGE